MKLAALTIALIRASEKAATIARAMRSDQSLFTLLVEEKKGDAKNKRFVQDFKTLGDVLVQEMVRHNLAEEFPGIGDNIYGEESNKFTNTIGESLVVQVQATEEETRRLLATVLDDNRTAAKALAETVHQNVPVPFYSELENVTDEIDPADVGIWIDPIDSTAQFIHGFADGVEESGVHEQGLQCVVVIIGVYNKTNGLPIIGVCNQPFSSQEPASQTWLGRCLWGLNYNDTKRWHIPKVESEQQQCSAMNKESTPAIVMSSSEKELTKEKLKAKYHLQYAAGAGYKILCVLDHLVAGYVLSSGSTFKWDTCGPHAIIRAMGGDIISLDAALSHIKKETDGIVREEDLSAISGQLALRYHIPDAGERPAGEEWSNSGGLIAYLDSKELFTILRVLMV